MSRGVNIPDAADRAAQRAYEEAGGDGVWWRCCMPDADLKTARDCIKDLVGAVRALEASPADLWAHCVNRFFDVYPWTRASRAAQAAMVAFCTEARAGWRALDDELDRLERKPKLRDVRAAR